MREIVVDGRWRMVVGYIRGMRESMEVLGSCLPMHANRSTGNCRLPVSPSAYLQVVAASGGFGLVSAK